MNRSLYREDGWKQLQSCKKKLFTEPQSEVKQFHPQEENFHFNNPNKLSTYASIAQTQTKKIKLKPTNKTAKNQTNNHNVFRNELTPQKHLSNKRIPLLERHINTQVSQRYLKTDNTDQKLNSNSQNKFNSARLSLLPSCSPNKILLQNSRFTKYKFESQQPKQFSEKSQSKSKKKIHFTVYNSKFQDDFTMEKEPSIKVISASKFKYVNLQNSMRSNVMINLCSVQNQHTVIKKSRSKESRCNRSQSKSKNIHRSLPKTIKTQQFQSQIQRVLQKIDKYTFVQTYIQRLQIQQLLVGYQIIGEPQCKWALLIVDQVFKRMRDGGKFQTLVSKS